ncbi:hypothetical protein [[Clostridium] hylemonae]|uniref:Uncharacterized protein n=1 Tax=[Clostridium] hylemonae DSM 15053 TaxID=553973 RepID=C0BY62_9FIRM|nr:hypothetical protein [[Clostridium] hylemonae]EEG75133.1 hypothetical protein CLOHYLEM_04750 [[Clostridium] hylemonae DSM 15053]MCB7520903.1 AE-binding protein [[Clostridium] hylemonae]QEK18153.1 hypothetical protein LAJLEIBI_02169 [[Clostridium] hylemonae DSM 15053]BDF05168.1 hypothetical protein CE91St63_22300 [[Clostridium] hylemonae]
MKENKSSFTTERPIDYTESKDAYDGKISSAASERAAEPLPESERPRKDGPGGE